MMDLGSSKGPAAGRYAVVGAMVVVLSACVESPIMNADGSLCDLDNNLLIASLAPNAIPALTEPQMVAADYTRMGSSRTMETARDEKHIGNVSGHIPIA